MDFTLRTRSSRVNSNAALTFSDNFMFLPFLRQLVGLEGAQKVAKATLLKNLLPGVFICIELICTGPRLAFHQ